MYLLSHGHTHTKKKQTLQKAKIVICYKFICASATNTTVGLLQRYVFMVRITYEDINNVVFVLLSLTAFNKPVHVQSLIGLFYSRASATCIPAVFCAERHVHPYFYLVHCDD